jgi:rubrerythrin
MALEGNGADMSEAWESLLLAGWNQRKAVELAITIEEMGAAIYRALESKWQGNDGLRALFARLAQDEVGHERGLRTLLASVAPEREASELDGECLKAIAHGFFQSREGWALSGIEVLASEAQVLEKVLKFENSTLHFYRALKDVLGASPALDEMIAEEKRHVVEILRALGRAREAEGGRAA